MSRRILCLFLSAGVLAPGVYWLLLTMTAEGPGSKWVGESGLFLMAMGGAWLWNEISDLRSGT